MSFITRQFPIVPLALPLLSSVCLENIFILRSRRKKECRKKVCFVRPVVQYEITSIMTLALIFDIFQLTKKPEIPSLSEQNVFIKNWSRFWVNNPCKTLVKGSHFRISRQILQLSGFPQRNANWLSSKIRHKLNLCIKSLPGRWNQRSREQTTNVSIGSRMNWFSNNHNALSQCDSKWADFQQLIIAWRVPLLLPSRGDNI